jgi:uncharacterized integral membrane protein
METPKPKEKSKFKRVLRIISLIIVLLFGIVFTLLNPGIVQVNFITHEVALPLSILMFVCFAVGMILGLIIGYARSWRRLLR